MSLVTTIIFTFFGLYSLYVTRRHWRYVSQLPDSVGNRKIKREQKGLLVWGVLSLLYAAWNVWLFAKGSRPYSQASQTDKGITGNVVLFLLCGYSLWFAFKSSRGNRVIQCGSITVLAFAVTLALFKVRDLPAWVLPWAMLVVFLLCMITMLFLVQQGYRALRRRKTS